VDVNVLESINGMRRKELKSCVLRVLPNVKEPVDREELASLVRADQGRPCSRVVLLFAVVELYEEGLIECSVREVGDLMRTTYLAKSESGRVAS
jgi:hypothetical protein